MALRLLVRPGGAFPNLRSAGSRSLGLTVVSCRRRITSNRYSPARLGRRLTPCGAVCHDVARGADESSVRAVVGLAWELPEWLGGATRRVKVSGTTFRFGRTSRLMGVWWIARTSSSPNEGFGRGRSRIEGSRREVYRCSRPGSLGANPAPFLSVRISVSLGSDQDSNREQFAFAHALGSHQAVHQSRSRARR